jgi:hypothetical protein
VTNANALSLKDFKEFKEFVGQLKTNKSKQESKYDLDCVNEEEFLYDNE